MAGTRPREQQRVTHVATLDQEAQLLAPEQEARARAEAAADRLARFQRVTASLSEALMAREVARAIIDEGLAALGASAGLLATLTCDGTELEVVAAAGYSPDLLETYGRIPLTAPLPLAEAVRNGEPLWLESLQSRRECAGESAYDHAATGIQSAANVPLIVQGRAIGAIALSFAETRAFGEDERTFIVALAQECALALERARLYEAECAARIAAEAAEARLRESEERFRAMTDTAPDAIITINDAGEMVSINPATERVFGYTREEMLGRPITMLMPEHLRQL